MSRSKPVARLTRTAYAAHRKALGLPGGTLRSAQHALADGRITIGSDGKLDPAEADRKWRDNTMPDRGGTRPGAGRPRRRKEKARKGADGREATTMPELRRQREAVRLRRERLELRRLERDTFSKAEVDAYVFKWIRGLRDACLTIPPREAATGAAELGVDEGALFRWLMSVIRRFLQRQADARGGRQARPTEDSDEDGQS